MRRFDSRETSEPAAADAKSIEAAAVRLLARREHSIEELKRKLVSRGHEEAQVGAIVEKLLSKRLVSDERFAAGMVRHRAQRGQGPIRIRAELREQGVADAVIEQEFETAGVDWNQLAADVRRRKFGAAPPGDFRLRAKQARFLQYRGFSADQISAALGGSEESE